MKRGPRCGADEADIKEVGSRSLQAADAAGSITSFSCHRQNQTSWSGSRGRRLYRRIRSMALMKWQQRRTTTPARVLHVSPDYNSHLSITSLCERVNEDGGGVLQ
ncbi:hypothetical protein JOB18_030335 [Solea senegalensis]|uniref:Uncharacterized protein n=1 Tax=Solea senegalensis TaxID=28829 RepID=A0AAV6Q4G1_SOLSE|nr:hypothetical protein JOB18_030335 [Solea senegalensis]